MYSKTILIGHAGADATLGEASGRPVTNFRLATSLWFKRDGERQKKTSWHACSMYGPLAERASQLISKGALLLVEGRIDYRHREREDGSVETFTNIVVDTFRLLSRREAEALSDDDETADEPPDALDEEGS